MWILVSYTYLWVCFQKMVSFMFYVNFVNLCKRGFKSSRSIDCVWYVHVHRYVCTFLTFYTFLKTKLNLIKLISENSIFLIWSISPKTYSLRKNKFRYVPRKHKQLRQDGLINFLKFLFFISLYSIVKRMENHKLLPTMITSYVNTIHM
jgi:hypothetical protein